MKKESIFKQYFQRLADVAVSGDAREESFYSSLEGMMKCVAEATARPHKILERLGEGVMGVIYKVEDTTLGCTQVPLIGIIRLGVRESRNTSLLQEQGISIPREDFFRAGPGRPVRDSSGIPAAFSWMM